MPRKPKQEVIAGTEAPSRIKALDSTIDQLIEVRDNITALKKDEEKAEAKIEELLRSNGYQVDQEYTAYTSDPPTTVKLTQKQALSVKRLRHSSPNDVGDDASGDE